MLAHTSDPDAGPPIPARSPATTDDILAAFARTTDEIFSLDELKRLLDSGRQIRIKYGVDVTAPFLHIGHAVNLWMMRRLQDLGHKVILLIGDATTRIGDPTGRNQLRPVIPDDEISANAERFIAQAGMVLRLDDPDLIEIRRNSEWYDPMPAGTLLRLLAMVTHARLISRDMFQRRLAEGADIHLHELVYPVLQGYDSFALRSDLTIIGSDQLFNEMLGRFYQERLGQDPQVIITTTITPGIDGTAKQSKSLDNYIGLGHSPRDKFGRTMRVPDDLIATYLRVYTDLPLDTIAAAEVRVPTEPMASKLFLAHAIVARYHGADVADAEHDWFVRTFSARQTPTDIPEVPVDVLTLRALDLVRRCLGPGRSNTDLRRLFAQRAITLDGDTLTDPDREIVVRDGTVLRAGKRSWFRLRVGPS
jgi:tyrosyl-tRNA synthetase